MTEPHPPSPARASYGRSMLVAIGWYATVITAVLVGLAGLPKPVETECSAMFSCLTPLEGAGLAAVVLGVPVFGGLLVGTAVITALVTRRIGSPILAGTLSAGAAVAAVAMVGAVWQSAR